MKRIITLIVVVFLLSVSSFGQWYYSDYNVTDVDSLSLEQLEDALASNKDDMLISGGVILIGGLIVGGGFLTLETGLSDDPGFLEELLGSEIMGKVYIGLGIGISAVGVIMCLGDLGQRAEIKSAIRRNFPTAGTMSISPAMIMNSYNNTLTPGITISVRF